MISADSATTATGHPVGHAVFHAFVAFVVLYVAVIDTDVLLRITCAVAALWHAAIVAFLYHLEDSSSSTYIDREE